MRCFRFDLGTATSLVADLHRSSGRSNGSNGSRAPMDDIWTVSCSVNGLDWRASQCDRSLAFDDEKGGGAGDAAAVDDEDDDEAADEAEDEENSGLDCFAYF